MITQIGCVRGFIMKDLLFMRFYFMIVVLFMTFLTSPKPAARRLAARLPSARWDIRRKVS